MRLVRLATEDAERAAALHADCFPASQAWSVADFRSLLQQDSCRAWALSEGGVFCAMVLYQGTEPDADLLTLCTAPALRRDGLGLRLLRESLSAMGDQGFDKILLEVSEHNRGAISLYLNAGFEQVAIRPKYYASGGGEAADAHLMVAKIAGQM